MVIITWKQNEGGVHRRGETYAMRAVVKPIASRTDLPFTVERAHVDAAGGQGWVPANHTHAAAIVCKALLALVDGLQASAGGRPSGGVIEAASGRPSVIDLGVLDLPED